MADCPNYACADWEDYIPGTCGATKIGGHAKAILMKCGQTIAADLTDAAALGTEIAAKIAAGNAKLIEDILVQMPAPSAVTGTSYIANTTEQPITYDRTITWADQNVTDSTVQFYNSINGATGYKLGGMLLLNEDGTSCIWVDGALTGTGGLVDENGANMRFEFTFGYRKKTDPRITAVPDNVF